MKDICNSLRNNLSGRLLGQTLMLLLAAATGRAETLVLHPLADTSLLEAFPDSNFGGGTTITAGGRNQGGRARALLRFDPAGNLPTGAVILSATLKLQVQNANGGASTFDLHRLVNDWGEGNGDDHTGTPANAGSATWNKRSSPTAWTANGGDFVATASASAAIAGNGSCSFAAAALAEDVRNWFTNPAANFGWLLRSQSEATPGTIRRFAGRGDSLSPPELTIEYSATTTPAAQPVLSAAALVAGGIRFSFNAESNRTYTVESRSSLTATNWNPLTNFPALAADAAVHFTNSVLAPETYFRVRTH